MKVTLSRADAARYGRRGGRARAAIVALHIEGEAVTIPRIAARLGIAQSTARKRIEELRTRGEPITWQGLGCSSSTTRDSNIAS
jgi:predicted ArsR family transcriptional regulator